MTQKDYSAIAAIGVLTAAFLAILTSFGVQVPVAAYGVPGLVAGVTVFGLRLYIRLKGADNTNVDEKLDAIEDMLASIREEVGKK